MVRCTGKTGAATRASGAMVFRMELVEWSSLTVVLRKVFSKTTLSRVLKWPLLSSVT